MILHGGVDSFGCLTGRETIHRRNTQLTGWRKKQGGKKNRADFNRGLIPGNVAASCVAYGWLLILAFQVRLAGRALATGPSDARQDLRRKTALSTFIPRHKRDGGQLN